MGTTRRAAVIETAFRRASNVPRMPTVEANGVDLHYERRGEGPPVVFLHGAGLDHRLWPELADPLTDAYEVVVLDMRLHGRSGGDPDADPSFDDFVDDLHALVGELDLDRPVVVGHSLGGMVALAYADRYDDHAGIVTIGSETPDTPSVRAWVYDAVVFPVHYGLRDTLGQGAADRFMFAVNWLARDDAGLSDIDEFERITTDHHADYPEPTPAERDAIEATFDDYGDRDVDYSSIRVPVLALYGERELAVMADHAEHLADRVPDGRALGVPGAAHLSPVDDPSFVMDAIRDFLDERVATDARESGSA